MRSILGVCCSVSFRALISYALSFSTYCNPSWRIVHADSDGFKMRVDITYGANEVNTISWNNFACVELIEHIGTRRGRMFHIDATYSKCIPT